MTKTLVFLSSVACAVAVSAPAFAKDEGCATTPAKEKCEKSPPPKSGTKDAPRPPVTIDTVVGVGVREDPPATCPMREARSVAPKALPEPAAAQSLFYLR